ncbi:MAG: shikimate kinase [Clostridia bacterium]|nr:shikimate kinase [Clostridia bacterium]
MKTNITLLLPLNDYKKQVGKLIANKLNMIYVDVEEFLKFELFDIDKALALGGYAYLQQEEDKLIKRLSTYNNSFITIDFSMFNREKNLAYLKENSLIVYLKFFEKDYIKLLKKEKTGAQFELDKKLFEKRDELMTEYSDLVVSLINTNKKDVLKAFLSAVNNYYA